MSTEHQKYSTSNQIDAIAKYAAAKGMRISRTYADDGKSGLRLEGRDALQRLISDVQSGNIDFETILVYDVSRWGRFQDADESAYYEFACKEAGIAVQYCAEQFENDGSLPATIIKTMKRAMAGEYSRELSAKVFAGQCRLVSLGFRQGGPAGFGLRRQLIDEQRNAKTLLRKGERKSLQTDRVILVPGPPEEIAIVRQIFDLFTRRALAEKAIAEHLNRQGIVNDLGLSWTRGSVHQVLTNEKYVGNNVYNRVSFKLRQKRIQNPPDKWIRSEGAFEAVIDRGAFDLARRIIEDRSRQLTDEEMLEHLQRIYNEKHVLSALLIDEMESVPSSTAYRSRFGSLVRAYRLVGYVPARDYAYLEINRALRTVFHEVVDNAISKITAHGGKVSRDPTTDLLTINHEFTASIVVVRCQRSVSGVLRWKVRLDAKLQPDITVAIRMEPSNEFIQDYYLLPRIDLQSAMLRLVEDNGIFLDAYRFDSLDALALLSQRTGFEEAA
jgi:DNA invertase Pin-like site-specific DNA recombinase